MTIIKSPIIEPYIFDDIFSNYILSNEKENILLDYKELSKVFYNSDKVKYYNLLSEKLILDNVKQDENLILYMNFKSRNILIKKNREKMYNIIKKFNPNIICLSEALLPINIHNNKERNNNNNIKLSKIDIKDDTIITPYKSSSEFKKKKNKTKW